MKYWYFEEKTEKLLENEKSINVSIDLNKNVILSDKSLDIINYNDIISLNSNNELSNLLRVVDEKTEKIHNGLFSRKIEILKLIDKNIMSLTLNGYLSKSSSKDLEFNKHEVNLNDNLIDCLDEVLHENNTSLYKVNYVTNRKYCTNENKYKNDRDSKLNYGYCDVYIPDSHKFGSIGSNWFKRWVTFNDDRLKINDTYFCEKEDFFNGMRENVSKSDTVVFIHGFNTTFEDSIIRSAQIGFDLEIDNMIAFSWPSIGEVSDYSTDTTNIEYSINFIKQFLLEVSNFIEDTEKIHIIAHSMGNRGLIRAFENMFLTNNLNKFGQIFLAAPDMDSDVFKQLAYVYPRQSLRTTLYVSNKDKALKASQWIYKSPRVGLSPPVTIVDNIDTIEVSDVDLTDFLGHTYIANSSTLIYDIRDLIINNVEPIKRFRLSNCKSYWKFKN